VSRLEQAGVLLSAVLRTFVVLIALLALAAPFGNIGSVVERVASLANGISIGDITLKPARIAIARGKLPPGTHTITLSTPAGPRSVQVNISGRYTFISLRMIRGQFFPMLPVAGLGGGTPQAQLGGGTPQAQESAPASTGPIVESQSNLEESVK